MRCRRILFNIREPCSTCAHCTYEHASGTHVPSPSTMSAASMFISAVSTSGTIMSISAVSTSGTIMSISARRSLSDGASSCMNCAWLGLGFGVGLEIGSGSGLRVRLRNCTCWAKVSVRDKVRVKARDGFKVRVGQQALTAHSV